MSFDVFDPIGEYNTLRVVPPTERKAREQTFWRERTEQRMGISTLAALVIDEAFANPTITKETLLELVKEARAELRLAPYQEAIARNLIKGYIERREKIAALRQAHPDDVDLFGTLYPRLKEGVTKRDVRIIERPCTLHLQLSRRIYPHVFHGGNTDEKEHSGGFFARRKPLLTHEKSSFFSTETTTLLHEEMHALYYFFGQILEKHLPAQRETYPLPSTDGLIPAFVHEGVLSPLDRYLRALLYYKADEIKDEIFAYTRTSYGSTKTGNTLLQKEDRGGSYDFFQEDLTELEQKLRPALTTTQFEQVRMLTQRQFPAFHRELVERGIASIRTLLTRHHWTFMEAAFFLIDIPLQHWPREVAMVDALKK